MLVEYFRVRKRFGSENVTITIKFTDPLSVR